ncbi:hypothetical protein [Marivirga sp.]|uniref:hypothetical protein n=1 Tax=Marivirga sp. TaxID=2018662 RepID=UPI002D7E828E|nr:hypothetical protein [Marivirga sp.]HET8858840.1 hypothetical protein [Marivirga sp.]
MKNIKFYFAVLFMICSIHYLNAQGGASKSKVIDVQTTEYDILLSQYVDGKQNLSWEEGEKLFGMGGNLQEILEKLFDEYEWKVDDKWLKENYHLRINYKAEGVSKSTVNQIFLRQLPDAIGANIEKSKIQKKAICVDLESSEEDLVKAKDRNAMNKIMRRGNDLKIHSVKLQDLERLLNLNANYLIKMDEVNPSSNRYDFEFNIENEKQLKASLSSYGLDVNDCEVEKTQVLLY